MTQNNVHHLWSQYHSMQCILVDEVQFNELQFWKCLSERNISKCAAIWQTARFGISLRIFQLWMFSDIQKMSEQFLCLKITSNQKTCEIWQDHLKSPSYFAIWDFSNTKIICWNMQVSKYASTQVCKYGGICKYANIQVCKYSSMQSPKKLPN